MIGTIEALKYSAPSSLSSLASSRCDRPCGFSQLYHSMATTAGVLGLRTQADLRGLHFPHLHALILGAYLFSHDWQLEWLASHAATLKHLDLDGCAILVVARRLAALDTDGYSRPIVDSPTRRLTTRVYDRQWSGYFSKMATSLTNLLVFKTGQLLFDDHEGPAPGAYEDSDAIMLPTIYLECSRGQYSKLSFEGDGVYHSQLKQFAQEWARRSIEDSEALHALLKVTAERRGNGL